VRLRAPLTAGQFTRFVFFGTAGGTRYSQCLFFSSLFRFHSDYDALFGARVGVLGGGFSVLPTAVFVIEQSE
jgi:hypothetical protein